MPAYRLGVDLVGAVNIGLNILQDIYGYASCRSGRTPDSCRDTGRYRICPSYFCLAGDDRGWMLDRKENDYPVGGALSVKVVLSGLEVSSSKIFRPIALQWEISAG